MRGLLSEARRVQLIIQLFNKINCWFLQGMKVVLLVAAIIHGYVGIRLRQTDLFLAIFCAVAHVVLSFLYCGTFDRAYRLQELQQELKIELIAACGKLSPDYMLTKESLKAAVNSLSCPGLRVGSFHEMERQSAVTFIDFVEQQTISLLLTF